MRLTAQKNLLPCDGEAFLIENALPVADADDLFQRLMAETPWRTETIRMMGRMIEVPRRIAYHGDLPYRYSGLDHPPLAWTATLDNVRALVEPLAGARFNAVLLNLYRGGADSMGYHADDEPCLGRDPIIASLSLGATRRFNLRHKRRKEHRLTLELDNATLLVMAGAIQHHWLHQVPKTRRPVGPRINLTFRRIHGAAG